MQLLVISNPLISQHRNRKLLRRARRIKKLIMHTPQLKLRTPRIRNLTTIITRQRMPTAKHIIHPPNGSLIIRAPIETDNPPQPTIRIAAVTLPVPDIMHPVPDVLVVALQAVCEVDVEGFERPVPPRMVVWHTGPAEVNPGAVAGGLVGLAPVVCGGGALAAEAAVGVDVGLVVDAVQAVGAVVPLEVVDGPGGDGAAVGGCDGLCEGCGGKGQKAGQEAEDGHFDGGLC
jgi:hypothetical protein